MAIAATPSAPARRIIVLFMTIMMRLIESCITISLEPLPIAERTERSRQMGRTKRSVPRRWMAK